MSERTKASEGNGRKGTKFEFVAERSGEILNVRSEIERRRSFLGKLIHQAGRWLSNPLFFFGLLIFHTLWIVLNSQYVPGVESWDPYPFPVLAMIASVEAPFLSLLILMSQYRDERVEEVREEVNLQVSLWIERELTSVLRMAHAICQKMEIEAGVDPNSLKEMESPLHPEMLLERVEKEVGADEGEQNEDEGPI